MDRRTRVIYLAVALLALFGLFGLQAVLADSGEATASVEQGSYPGNTLISVQDYKFDGRLIEVSPEGEVVWEYEPDNSRVFDGEQLANGNVLVSVATKLPAEDCPDEQLEIGSDSCVHNRVLELNQDKDVVWKHTWYDAYVTHHEVHDADRLANGETVIIDMGNNRVFTVDKNENVTWEWDAEKHLGEGSAFDQEYTSPEKEGPESDWTHMNDVDQLANGNFQLSIRNFDVLIEVNPETDEIVDVVGKPGDHDLMKEQHNPHRLEQWGTVVVADSENDRIVEIDVQSEEIIWQYGGNDLVHWPRDADRLPNGNTLITDSFNERVIEVNPEGEIVWQYEGLSMPYEADRLSVPEEGGETVPGWRLDGRTEQAGAAVGTVRQLEAWASFVFPQWVKLPELLTLAAAALVALWLAGELAFVGWHRVRSDDDGWSTE